MSRIKECFVTRFAGGKLVQFDYSQLEVICLAFLSSDRNLILDLKSGVDMHSRAASFLTGEDYSTIRKAVDADDPKWVRIRRDAKACSFLIQYGGSAPAMSRSTGLSEAQCKKFINNYYARYNRVKSWQDDNIALVRSSRFPSDKMSSGFQLSQAWLGGVTNRRYMFTEQLAPEFLRKRGINTSFSPTQIKNYPVQGFATGDIVPMMLGILNRWLKKEKLRSLLVNTIHDSVILDMTYDDINCGRVDDIKELLERAPEFLKSVYDIDFNMELKVDVEIGENWGSMKPYEKA